MNILNAVLLKVATILFLLALFYPLLKRGLDKNRFKQGKLLYRLASFVDRRHEIIGKLALLCALVHGIISPVKILSFNWGTICFVAILVSIIPSAFHKKDKKDAGFWLHIVFSIPAFVTFVLHIVIESV